MAAVQNTEVFIPNEASIRTLPVHLLPRSIKKKIPAHPPHPTPTATLICPVELRDKGATPKEPPALPPGQFLLSVVTPKREAFELLQRFLRSSEILLQFSDRKPRAGSIFSKRRNLIILYDGQIFLSVRKKKETNSLFDQQNAVLHESEAPPISSPVTEGEGISDIIEGKRTGGGAEDHGKGAEEAADERYVQDGDENEPQTPTKDVSTNTFTANDVKKELDGDSETDWWEEDEEDERGTNPEIGRSAVTENGVRAHETSFRRSGDEFDAESDGTVQPVDANDGNEIRSFSPDDKVGKRRMPGSASVGPSAKAKRFRSDDQVDSVRGYESCPDDSICNVRRIGAPIADADGRRLETDVRSTELKVRSSSAGTDSRDAKIVNVDTDDRATFQNTEVVTDAGSFEAERHGDVVDAIDKRDSATTGKTHVESRLETQIPISLVNAKSSGRDVEVVHVDGTQAENHDEKSVSEIRSPSTKLCSGDAEIRDTVNDDGVYRRSTAEKYQAAGTKVPGLSEVEYGESVEIIEAIGALDESATVQSEAGETGVRKSSIKNHASRGQGFLPDSASSGSDGEVIEVVASCVKGEIPSGKIKCRKRLSFGGGSDTLNKKKARSDIDIIEIDDDLDDTIQSNANKTVESFDSDVEILVIDADDLTSRKNPNATNRVVTDDESHLCKRFSKAEVKRCEGEVEFVKVVERRAEDCIKGQISKTASSLVPSKHEKRQIFDNWDTKSEARSHKKRAKKRIRFVDGLSESQYCDVPNFQAENGGVETMDVFAIDECGAGKTGTNVGSEGKVPSLGAIANRGGADGSVSKTRERGAEIEDLDNDVICRRANLPSYAKKSSLATHAKPQNAERLRVRVTDTDETGVTVGESVVMESRDNRDKIALKRINGERSSEVRHLQIRGGINIISNGDEAQTTGNVKAIVSCVSGKADILLVDERETILNALNLQRCRDAESIEGETDTVSESRVVSTVEGLTDDVVTVLEHVREPITDSARLKSCARTPSGGDEALTIEAREEISKGDEDQTSNEKSRDAGVQSDNANDVMGARDHHSAVVTIESCSDASNSGVDDGQVLCESADVDRNMSHADRRLAGKEGQLPVESGTNNDVMAAWHGAEESISDPENLKPGINAGNSEGENLSVESQQDTTEDGEDGQVSLQRKDEPAGESCVVGKTGRSPAAINVCDNQDVPPSELVGICAHINASTRTNSAVKGDTGSAKGDGRCLILSECPEAPNENVAVKKFIISQLQSWMVKSGKTNQDMEMDAKSCGNPPSSEVKDSTAKKSTERGEEGQILCGSTDANQDVSLAERCEDGRPSRRSGNTDIVMEADGSKDELVRKLTNAGSGTSASNVEKQAKSASERYERRREDSENHRSEDEPAVGNGVISEPGRSSVKPDESDKATKVRDKKQVSESEPLNLKGESLSLERKEDEDKHRILLKCTDDVRPECGKARDDPDEPLSYRMNNEGAVSQDATDVQGTNVTPSVAKTRGENAASTSNMCDVGDNVEKTREDRGEPSSSRLTSGSGATLSDPNTRTNRYAESDVGSPVSQTEQEVGVSSPLTPLAASHRFDFSSVHREEKISSLREKLKGLEHKLKDIVRKYQ